MWKVKYSSTYKKNCESRTFKSRAGALAHALYLKTLADVKGSTVKVVKS